MNNFLFDQSPNAFCQAPTYDEAIREILEPHDHLEQMFDNLEYPTFKTRKANEPIDCQLPEDLFLDHDQFIAKYSSSEENTDADHTTEATSFMRSPA